MLAARNRPEILETDLAPLALELALWGVNDAGKLKWIDPPPEAALRKARRLLEDLGALAAGGAGTVRVTPHGRRMAELAIHPRLAHMLLMARREGAGGVACRLAALLGERDIVRFAPGAYDADLRLRLELLTAFERGPMTGDGALKVDTAACRRILKTSALFEKRLGVRGRSGKSANPGRLLAWAYPDRIARRRPGSHRRYLLANGHEARFDVLEALTARRFLVVAALDGDRRRARIFLAASYGEADLREQYGHRIEARRDVSWDAGAGSVTAVTLQTLDALVLKREPCSDAAGEQVAAALMEGIRRRGLDALPWNRQLSSWRARVEFLRRLEGAGIGLAGPFGPEPVEIAGGLAGPLSGRHHQPEAAQGRCFGKRPQEPPGSAPARPRGEAGAFAPHPAQRGPRAHRLRRGTRRWSRCASSRCLVLPARLRWPEGGRRCCCTCSPPPGGPCRSPGILPASGGAVITR